MRDTQVGAVLVVNDGALSGVVTDRDLVVRGLAEGEGPDSPVGPLCSGDLVGVAADADVAQAEQLMREHAVRRLPVINDGQVVGIVSIGDLAISADADSAARRGQPRPAEHLTSTPRPKAPGPQRAARDVASKGPWQCPLRGRPLLSSRGCRLIRVSWVGD